MPHVITITSSCTRIPHIAVTCPPRHCVCDDTDASSTSVAAMAPIIASLVGRGWCGSWCGCSGCQCRHSCRGRSGCSSWGGCGCWCWCLCGCCCGRSSRCCHHHHLIQPHLHIAPSRHLVAHHIAPSSTESHRCRCQSSTNSIVTTQISHLHSATTHCIAATRPTTRHHLHCIPAVLQIQPRAPCHTHYRRLPNSHSTTHTPSTRCHRHHHN